MIRGDIGLKKHWLRMVALVGVLALPLAAQDSRRRVKGPVEQTANSDKKVEPLKLGATVDENLVLRDIDGKQYKLKDLRGKTIFIHFWSMVCPYEPAAEPKFRHFSSATKARTSSSSESPRTKASSAPNGQGLEGAGLSGDPGARQGDEVQLPGHTSTAATR